MVYTKTTWREYGMSTTDKVNALNNMETQYDEMIAQFNAHNHTSRYYTKSEMDAKYYSASNDGSGSGLVAEYLDGYTAEQIMQGAIPSGLIVIWNGDASSVPAGWAICNGSNGTPDLRDRFVVGAGGSYSQGTTGGGSTTTPTCTFTAQAITLTDAQLPSHTHSYMDRTPNTARTTGPYSSLGTVTSTNRSTYYTCNASETYSGSRQAHGHENSSLSIDQINYTPPYMAKLFIMKL